MKQEEKTESMMDESLSADEVAQSDPEELGEGVSSGSPIAEQTEEMRPDVDGNVNESESDTKGRRWLPYLITAVVLAALTLLFAWAEGGYKQGPTWLIMSYWGSSIAISGILGISFGVVVWASNGGAFDIFAYGGRTFVRMFFKKDVLDHKYPTYYDYRESRKKKKRNFWFVSIVGAVYFIVGVVLLIIGTYLGR